MFPSVYPKLVDYSPSDGYTSDRILFVVLGTAVNEEFRKQHALTVRAMAEKADPFTKKRLLDLADRYDRKPRPPTAIPSIGAEEAQSA